MTTTRTETNIRPSGRRGWQNRNLRIYYNYKISLFSVSARAVRATPTQTKLMPAASTCLPTTSVQSSRATRPQMHPALRPRHLARHRMSPCSGALSCKMKPARSPDTPSTNSIHRDCQSERKILPPAERAHRHLNDPRTSTTRYRRKNERSRCRGGAGAPPRYSSSNRVAKYGLLVKHEEPARRQGRPSPLHGCAWFAGVRCF